MRPADSAAGGYEHQAALMGAGMKNGGYASSGGSAKETLDSVRTTTTPSTHCTQAYSRVSVESAARISRISGIRCPQDRQTGCSPLLRLVMTSTTPAAWPSSTA